ncbi:MAG TPA: ATP-binding protein [Steroidobacteraceae bacterium]|nr:ATP-binding protein [Steroidobacteraceae bacterium]
MRRRSSACSTFDALLGAVLAVLVAMAPAGATARALARPSADSAASSAERLATGEYLAGNFLKGALPPPEAQQVPITLPARFGAQGPSRGRAAHWVRLPFRLSAVPGRDYGVYLPYAAPRAAVFLNGVYLGASEEFDVPSSDSWNYPLYVPMPASLLRAGANELLIEVVASARGSTAELGPVWVGAMQRLHPQFERRLWLQVIGVEVVSLLVGLIGALVAVLWMRRRSETVFGLFALSCGIWITRNAQFFVIDTYSPFYFGVVTDAALFWLAAVLYTLCFRVLGQRFPRLEAALFAYAALATVAMLVAGPSHKFVVTAVAFALLVPLSPLLLVYLTRETLRAPSVLRLLLWLAALVSATAGAYDFALMLEWIPWPGAYLMPYSALFYAITVGWALIDRFVASHNEYEQLNAVLEARVRERERALAGHYTRAAELEREQAVAAERERILRDMHDGLGSQLIAARVLVEKGGQSSTQIAALLGDAMDELRIAIDSMKPSSKDLLLMLGNLRYRLEPRLNAAGINLHWDISGTAALERLGPTEVTEMTRIVQEVCTNAIQHSRATEMSLAVRCPDADTVELTITDNGRGYDPASVRLGEGLKNIHKRARTIGACLDLQSHPGETRVTLTMTAAVRLQ